MKRILLFYSSFVIAVGTAVMLFLSVAGDYDRNHFFALLGNRSAEHRLGVMFANGELGTVDNGKAVYWHERAAKKGDARSAFWLGLAYEGGKNTSKDNTKALAWYRAAALNHFEPAMLNFALMNMKGLGGKPDYISAVNTFMALSKKGNAQAMLNLARCSFLGQGLAKNDKLGADWVRKAAATPDARAEVLMGVLYLTGTGVEQDFDVAAQWLSLSKDKEALDLISRMNMDAPEIQALPANERKGKREEIYARAEDEIHALFERILEAATHPPETK